MEENLEKESQKEVKEKEEKKGKAAFFEKGGWYSKLPKNERTLKAVTVLVVFSGLAFIGLIVLGILLSW